MEKERINILIGSDINYAPYYGVMLTSLFINNRESQFDIFLLTDNSWTEKETKKFEKLCASYHSRFFVRVVEEEELRICPLNPNNHISRSTYYRLRAAVLLPDSVDKILYLDGDMIVCGDIRELWNYDISGKAIAGVVDSLQFDDETYNRLGFEKKYGYINAGVELINLYYWRKNQVSQLVINYIKNHQESLPMMDQDAINAVLAPVKSCLPICYNFQTMYLTKFFSKNFTSEFMNEVLITSKIPVVIHYNGGTKPWHWRYYGLPYRREWLFAYRHSSWCCAYKFTPLSGFVKYLVKRILLKDALIRARREQYIPESYDL